MRTHLLWIVILLVFAIGGASAQAQTDIAVSGSADITQNATGNGVTFTSPQGFGGVVEFRHIAGPLRGIEGAYSVVSPQNHVFTSTAPLSPKGFPCTPSCSFNPGPTTVEAWSQTFSGAWVPSKKVGKGRVFGLLGMGLLVSIPDNETVAVTLPPSGSSAGACASPQSKCVVNLFSTSASSRAAYVYGAGLDWPLGDRFGVRLQYRGEMYKAPNIVPSLYPSTNSFVQSAEPSLGISIRL